MARKILSFVMCMLIVVSTMVMSACGDDETDVYSGGSGSKTETVSSNEPMTICIYGIKEPGTTDAAIEKVEEALSKISVRKYNTTIDLILIEEEEYAAMMFAKAKMAINSYNTQRLSDKKLTADEKKLIMQSNVDYWYTTGDGQRYSYDVKEATNIPSEVLTGTLDIFLVYNPEPDSVVLDPDSEYYNKALTTYSMFDIMYNEQILAPLNSYFKGAYSAVKSTIHTHALQYVTRKQYSTSIDGTPSTVDDYFGVPNNYIYGDYDFVIFNKTFVDKLYSGTDKSEIAKDPAKLTALIKELTEKQGTEGFEYTNVEKRFTSYEEYLETANSETFAIGYISGYNAVEQLFESHENLDVYVTKENVVSSPSEYCDSMFAIGRSTESVERCLDILLLINSNKEFRNILQYGVEGVHYTQYRELITPISGDKEESKYFMDMKYSGNMFILYPSSDMDAEMRKMAENEWQLAKDQVIQLVRQNTSG